MAKINTYGITIKGIRKASGETFNYGAYSAQYDEIFYNRATGEVWTKYQVSLGQNTWTEYYDKDILWICNTQRHMTMQEIADAIRDKLREEVA